MKRLQAVSARHPIAFGLLVAVVVAVLTVNVRAQWANVPPTQFEYKTVAFKMSLGDDPEQLPAAFTAALNREAAAGWEFAGRCLHVDMDEFWVDYVVLRRVRR